MKTNPTIIAAAILGLAIVLSTAIYCCATRFTPVASGTSDLANIFSHDNWTGRFYGRYGVLIQQPRK